MSIEFEFLKPERCRVECPSAELLKLQIGKSSSEQVNLRACLEDAAASLSEVNFSRLLKDLPTWCVPFDGEDNNQIYFYEECKEIQGLVVVNGTLSVRLPLDPYSKESYTAPRVCLVEPGQGDKTCNGIEVLPSQTLLELHEDSTLEGFPLLGVKATSNGARFEKFYMHGRGEDTIITESGDGTAMITVSADRASVKTPFTNFAISFSTKAHTPGAAYSGVYHATFEGKGMVQFRNLLRDS